MTEFPKVSIIVPVKPGGRVGALAGIRALDYPTDAFEVFVAEGKCPSCQRNSAASAATGDILCFLDDDSLVAPEHLQRMVRHFSDPRVSAVGGPSLTPATDSLLQQSFGMALSSLVGGGGMRNRYRRFGTVRTTGDQELILCNLSFRRESFLQNGGFDERLYPNEENELMERIIRGGGMLVHDPDLAVNRSQRPTIGAFCRQLYSYGRGRGEQTVMSGVIKPITFVPSLFLIYLLLLSLIRKPVYYLPLLCYLLMTVALSIRELFRASRSSAVFFLPVVFVLIHICYGFGMLRGLVAPRFRKGGHPGGEVAIRRVKEFGQPFTG